MSKPNVGWNLFCCAVGQISSLRPNHRQGPLRLAGPQRAVSFSHILICTAARNLLRGRRRSHVRSVIGACRDIQAQRRFQKKLRPVDRCIPLSAIYQCRARPLLGLGRLGFLRLFLSVGLAGAARSDSINLVLISRITSSKLSTRTALSRANVEFVSVTHPPVPVPHEAGITRKSLVALLNSFSRSRTK